MIYLFNSAANKGYAKNVLNVLHFPKGCENFHHYAINMESNKNSYVQTELIERGENIIGEEAIIVCVNKEIVPYQYIPLRKAKISKIKKDQGRMYFYVEYEEYCTPKDNDYDKFNKEFVNKFKELLFQSDKYTEDTEFEKNNGGYLAFEGESIDNLIDMNSNSWIQTVKYLGKLKVFHESRAIFTKTSIEDVKGNVLNKLTKGKNYTLKMTYYIPFFTTDMDEIKLELVHSANGSVSIKNNSQQRLNVTHSNLSFDFLTLDVGECNFSVDLDKTYLIADRGFAVKVSHGTSAWIWIVLLLLLATIMLYISNDNSNIDSFQNLIGISFSDNVETGLKILSMIVPTLALWGAGAIYSKKQ